MRPDTLEGTDALGRWPGSWNDGGELARWSNAAARARPPLSLWFPARSESVAEARHSILDYARPLGRADIDDISLAVSEAVGNAVRHAYRVHEPGTIELRAELLVPDTLRVDVNDDGDGMSPHPELPGLGLGFSLIGAVTTGLEIECHQPHGTSLHMRFSLH
jgi:anti-sigma regulatory factor (Ser/Thr protein kinase)